MSFLSASAPRAPPFAIVFAPVDALRSRLLRAIAAAPSLRSLLVDREQRVALVASALMVTALLGASTLPLWLVVLGPLVWGIPHVVSDVRYLVTRPGYHRRPWIMLAIGGSIVAGVFGFGVRGALAATVFAAVTARGAIGRRAIAAGVAGALLAVAVWADWLADVAFAHLHHVVGLGLWWTWRRRATRLHWIPIALFAGGSALILTGATAPLLAWTGGLSTRWHTLTVAWLANSLSPDPDGAWATRLVLLYTFQQAAHYVIWMRAIPEDDRPSPTPRSFAQSFRVLGADVGAPLLWASVIGAVLLAARAVGDAAEARELYMRAAFFHGYIELIAAAVFWVEGRPVLRSPANVAATAPEKSMQARRQGAETTLQAWAARAQAARRLP